MTLVPIGFRPNVAEVILMVVPNIENNSKSIYFSFFLTAENDDRLTLQLNDLSLEFSWSLAKLKEAIHCDSNTLSSSTPIHVPGRHLNQLLLWSKSKIFQSPTVFSASLCQLVVTKLNILLIINIKTLYYHVKLDFDN